MKIVRLNRDCRLHLFNTHPKTFQNLNILSFPFFVRLTSVNCCCCRKNSFPISTLPPTYYSFPGIQREEFVQENLANCWQRQPSDSSNTIGKLAVKVIHSLCITQSVLGTLSLFAAQVCIWIVRISNWLKVTVRGTWLVLDQLRKYIQREATALENPLLGDAQCALHSQPLPHLHWEQSPHKWHTLHWGTSEIVSNIHPLRVNYVLIWHQVQLQTVFHIGSSLQLEA